MNFIKGVGSERERRGGWGVGLQEDGSLNRTFVLLVLLGKCNLLALFCGFV